MVVGAVADGVKEVMNIEPVALESVPKFGNDIPSEYISRIAKKGERFVMLLDLIRIS